MKFPNIKNILKKALELIPLILSIWELIEDKIGGKSDEEDE